MIKQSHFWNMMKYIIAVFIIKTWKLLEKNFGGYKAKMISLNSETKEVVCLLYDSFLLKCGLEEQHGRFEAGIEIGNHHVITEFLGKTCSMNSDVESIIASLQIIEEYCRLRLPDKFLDAYEKAYRVK